jgi:hypothetical protein
VHPSVWKALTITLQRFKENLSYTRTRQNAYPHENTWQFPAA